MIERALAALRPFQALTDPHVQGAENIPESRPLLFVGNHSLYGAIDPPLLFAELYARKGIVLRSLGDHLHFQIPGWRALLHACGAVDGTPETCAALMAAGESVLVFPGGGREVAKRKGEEYRLIWKERLGFVRLAAAHGCTIVPFACVGVEDAFKVVLDADEVLDSTLAAPLARALERLNVRREVLLPLVRPRRPQRIYFGFSEAISTEGTAPGDDDALRALRDRVRSAVAGEIASLRAFQAADPRRSLVARLAEALASR